MNTPAHPPTPAATDARFPGLVAFVAGIVVLGLKLLAYALTGSEAVLSDALESIVNVIAAGLAYALIWFSSRPADRGHPYGHGKTEFFSASFEGGLISFAAIFIMLRSAHALWTDHEMVALTSGMIVVTAASVINLVLGLYLLRAGRVNHSSALVASGHHILSDVWTSVASLIGLMAVSLTGITELDPMIAFGMGGFLGWTGFRIVRRSFGALMDEEEPELLESFTRACQKVEQPGLIKIHHARMMRSGGYHFIDAHVVVPEFWDVRRAHDSVNQFERALMAVHSHPGEIHFHVDPCRRNHCRNCDLAECPIRVEPFAQRAPYTPERIVAKKAE